MGRKILAVIVAMITACGIIWIAYMISSMMAPHYPKNLEYMSRDEMAAYMQSVPMSTFVVVLIGYALAAFAGGFIAYKMGRRWSAGPTLAFIVGVLLTLGSAAMSQLWPQPMWFLGASLIVFIPFSLIGYRLAK